MPLRLNIARDAVLAGTYGAGALATWFVSEPFWFLTAGWRLGWLWQTPARLWPWLYCTEVLAFLLLPRGGSNLQLSVDSLIVPLIYMGVVAAVRSWRARHPGQGEMPWLIGAGLAAAGLNSLLISAVQGAAAGIPSALWTPAPFWIGDAVGCLTLAPLLLAMTDAARPGTRGPSVRIRAGWLAQALLPTAAYWMLLQWVEPVSAAAAPVLASTAVVLLAWRYGWRVVAFGLLPLGASMSAASRTGLAQLPGFELQLIVVLVALFGL